MRKDTEILLKDFPLYYVSNANIKPKYLDIPKGLTTLQRKAYVVAHGLKPINENKVGKKKYIRISGQTVHNNTINKFSINSIKKFIYAYIKNELETSYNKKDVYTIKQERIIYPIRIHFTLKAPRNLNSVRMKDDILVLPKKGNKNVEGTWDLDNFFTIWCKCILDSLTINEIIKDDSIKYITNLEFSFEHVEDINKRVIIINIYQEL